MWIEMVIETRKVGFDSLSRPARALWIEMSGRGSQVGVVRVEAREGLVD